MKLREALTRCSKGQRVRPVFWRTINPRCWIESRMQGVRSIFVEFGAMQEMCHALRLQFEEEFLGDWEVVHVNERGDMDRPPMNA